MAHGSEKKAIEALEKSIAIYRQRVQANSACEFLTGKQKYRRSAVPDKLSDDRSRLAAGIAMIKCLVDEYAAFDTRPDRRWFMMTLCLDEGQIEIGSEVPPLIKKLSHKAYKAAAQVGLHGPCVIDFAPFRKSKLHPEMVWAHPVIFGYTDNPGFKPNVAAKALMKRRAFSNSLGLPSVTIVSRKKSANSFKGSAQYRKHLFADLHQNQTENSMAWVGYYLWQAPSYVKHAYKPKSGKREVQLRTGIENYSPRLALAVEAILDQVSAMDVVFGVGDGRRIRADWKRLYIKAIGGRSIAGLSRRKRPKRRKVTKAKARVRHRRALQS